MARRRPRGRHQSWIAVATETAQLGGGIIDDHHHAIWTPVLELLAALVRRGLMLHELERLQARRRGELVSLPAVVDVNVSIDTEPRVVDARSAR